MPGEGRLEQICVLPAVSDQWVSGSLPLIVATKRRYLIQPRSDARASHTRCHLQDSEQQPDLRRVPLREHLSAYVVSSTKTIVQRLVGGIKRFPRYHVGRRLIVLLRYCSDMYYQSGT